MNAEQNKIIEESKRKLIAVVEKLATRTDATIETDLRGRPSLTLRLGEKGSGRIIYRKNGQKVSA